MFSSLLLPMRRRLFLSIASRLEYGSVDITLADGTTHSYAGPHKGPHADVSFLTDRALTWVIKDGKMGFCEAYMAGGKSGYGDIECKGDYKYIERKCDIWIWGWPWGDVDCR